MSPASTQSVECPTEKLIQRLLAAHQRWLYQELPWIDSLIGRLEQVEGAEPGVTAIRRTFDRLRHEMAEELRQEDHVLFPEVLELMAMSGPVRPLEFLRAGNLAIDLKQRLLLREGKRVHLSPKEFDLLCS